MCHYNSFYALACDQDAKAMGMYRPDLERLPSIEIGDDAVFGDDGLEDGDGLCDENLLSPTGSSSLPSPVPRKSFADLKAEFMRSQWNTIETTVIYDNGTNELFTHSSANITKVNIDDDDQTCSDRCWNRIENFFLGLQCSGSFKTSNVYRNTMSVFNTVDSWARRIFPLTFLVSMLIYWSSYTYIL